MVKKTNKTKPKELEIGRNAAIVIGLVIIIGGYYIISNPITTGVVLFLGVVVAGIAVAGKYFGGGIAGMLSKVWGGK